MQIHAKRTISVLIVAAAVAALWVVNLRACSNISPSSSRYPKIRASPNFFINVTLLKTGPLRSPVASFWAATNKDSECTYFGSQGGVPTTVVYDFWYPLPLTEVNGVLKGILAYDRFDPGPCGFQYRETSYRYQMPFDVPPSNNDHWLPMISDDPSRMMGNSTEERVDLWCSIYVYSDGEKSQNCGKLRGETYGEHAMISQSQLDAAVAAGMKDPPALIHPNTRSVIIQLHNLDAPDHDLSIRTE
jgi:hypothetical protein